MSSDASAVVRQGDFRTIGLVGVAHGTSHFFHMLLPPLFPLFVRDFGVSYAQLGLVVTVFFVVSGIGQALAGFLVDRVGARPVLFAALACFAALHRRPWDSPSTRSRSPATRRPPRSTCSSGSA